MLILYMLCGINTKKTHFANSFKSISITLENVAQICAPVFPGPLTNIITFTMVGVGRRGTDQILGEHGAERVDHV